MRAVHRRLTRDLSQCAVRHVEDVAVDQIEAIALHVGREAGRQGLAGFELHDQPGSASAAAAIGAAGEFVIELPVAWLRRLALCECRLRTGQDKQGRKANAKPNLS